MFIKKENLPVTAINYEQTTTILIRQLRGSLDVLATNSLVEVMEGLETLLVYAKNLILFPEEKKYRKVKKSNVHYQQRLGHLTGLACYLFAIFLYVVLRRLEAKY